MLPAFSSALKAIADGACVIDVAGLHFIDASGLRTIAQAALSTGATMQLRGAQPHLQRIWNLVGLQHSAPTVQLIPQ